MHKTIKIAYFGVARIEVLTKGMTPDTRTYEGFRKHLNSFLYYINVVNLLIYGAFSLSHFTNNILINLITYIYGIKGHCHLNNLSRD